MGLEFLVFKKMEDNLLVFRSASLLEQVCVGPEEGLGATEGLVLGGKFSPGLQCSGGLSSEPFCVEFACSPRVHKGFLHIEPQRKRTEKIAPCPSLTKTDLIT